MSEQQRPCAIGEEGLAPCYALSDVLELGGSGTRHQGVKLQTMINTTSNSFSRHLVVVKSGKHSKKGIVFNFCPFCGVEIVKGAEEFFKRSAA